MNSKLKKHSLSVLALSLISTLTACNSGSGQPNNTAAAQSTPAASISVTNKTGTKIQYLTIVNESNNNVLYNSSNIDCNDSTSCNVPISSIDTSQPLRVNLYSANNQLVSSAILSSCPSPV